MNNDNEAYGLETKTKWQPEPLSPLHEQTLKVCEKRIEAGKAAFIDTIEAFDTIHRMKLYRKTHETFAEYVRERWDFSKSHAYRLLDFLEKRTEIQRNVPLGDTVLPTNERQTRELGKVPKKKLAKVWNRAVKSANGQQPTADQVKRAVASVVEPTREPAPASTNGDTNHEPRRCPACGQEIKP